jgi:pyridoxamine 5'-phosphate oxidase
VTERISLAGTAADHRSVASPRMADRELRESEVLADPIAELERWIDEARLDGVRDWDAMVVATADADGAPAARVVLLRGVDQRGLRFYSNYESRKGRELDENPRAALVLHWREQGRQVRITGAVARLTPEESIEYWRNRPPASRVSAWASHQSEPVVDRAALEAEVDAIEARFRDDDVPLPPFWGGYLVTPDEVELWQHRDDRLHDRLRYRRAGDGWTMERLQP